MPFYGKDGIEHQLYYCTINTTFWRQFQCWMLDKSGDWHWAHHEIIILGVLIYNNSKLKNLLILLPKWSIYNSKAQNELVYLIQVITLIKEKNKYFNISVYQIMKRFGSGLPTCGRFRCLQKPMHNITKYLIYNIYNKSAFHNHNNSMKISLCIIMQVQTIVLCCLSGCVNVISANCLMSIKSP